MTQALIFGLISGSALVIGALAGIGLRLQQRTIAAIMAFGSGVLICALTFGLMEEAFKHGGYDAAILGFLVGGGTFILGDYLLHIYGGRRHKRRQLIPPRKNSGGSVITLGAVLDGIPESIALGAAVANNTGTGILLVVAIFLSNLPESVSSITGLRREGYQNGRIIGMWSLVGLVTVLVTVASYAFLRSLSGNTIGLLESFAAGAILAMLADSMMPEAFEEGGLGIGVLTILGFLVAFLISRI